MGLLDSIFDIFSDNEDNTKYVDYENLIGKAQGLTEEQIKRLLATNQKNQVLNFQNLQQGYQGLDRFRDKMAGRMFLDRENALQNSQVASGSENYFKTMFQGIDQRNALGQQYLSNLVSGQDQLNQNIANTENRGLGMETAYREALRKQTAGMPGKDKPWYQQLISGLGKVAAPFAGIPPGVV